MSRILQSKQSQFLTDKIEEAGTPPSAEDISAPTQKNHTAHKLDILRNLLYTQRVDDEREDKSNPYGNFWKVDPEKIQTALFVFYTFIIKQLHAIN